MRAAEAVPGGPRRGRPIKIVAGRADVPRMDATLLVKEEAAPAPAQTPARRKVVVRLPRAHGLRRRTALRAAVIGPAALGTSYAVLLIAVAVSAPAGRFVGALVGATCAAATVWWLCTRLLVVCTAGRLTIDHERIRIVDRGLLRDPIVVPRSQLRGVEIGAPDLVLGWVPVLGGADQTPNLTMRFTDLATAPRPRCRREMRPPPGAALTALALHVEDPAGAVDALTR
jgi:hypothetical protein